MAHETLKDSALISALRDLFSDLSDLVKKEVLLAKAELTEKISSKVQSAVWMAAGGLLGLIGFLLLVQAIVYGIASLGLALHWSYLIVALVFIAAAAAAVLYGRSLAGEPMTPSRTIRQVNADIRTAREQLS
jgi:hypothetical protein